MHKEHEGASADHHGAASSARSNTGYPLGRGYGHDYMRGGEVFGGYGYSDRPEYAQTRGEASHQGAHRESREGAHSGSG